MVARAFRRVLLFELGCYIAFGWVLVHVAKCSPVQAAALALGWAIGMRAFGVAASFVLAGLYAPPAPVERRIGFLGWLSTWLAELIAYVLAYNLYLPFEALFAGKERLGPLPSAQPPLLLLHGYVCNRGFMLPLRRFLRAHGVPAYTHNLEPIYADIDSYGDALARRVEEICAASGAGQVTLVAHSMGGLVARAYLRRYGERRVAKLITLGTPHHGTALARFGAGANARQMEPGNAWLQTLNAAPLSLPAVALFSYQDNIVSPRESGRLGGAKILALSGIGHISMAFSARVHALVLEEVQRRGEVPGANRGRGE